VVPGGRRWAEQAMWRGRSGGPKMAPQARVGFPLFSFSFYLFCFISFLILNLFEFKYCCELVTPQCYLGFSPVPELVTIITCDFN
jgi:hypothetical protein